MTCILTNRSDPLDNTQATHALSPCSVHTGFADNIMRLSIAGLRYWRDLGLQPVGGKKDITAFVICEVGDGIKRAADTFLRQMEETYEVSRDKRSSACLILANKRCRLGSHRAGETAMSVNGVVSIPLAGFADTIGMTILPLLFQPTLYSWSRIGTA